jgi:hypothetical protein
MARIPRSIPRTARNIHTNFTQVQCGTNFSSVDHKKSICSQESSRVIRLRHGLSAPQLQKRYLAVTAAVASSALRAYSRCAYLKTTSSPASCCLFVNHPYDNSYNVEHVSTNLREFANPTNASATLCQVPQVAAVLHLQPHPQTLAFPPESARAKSSSGTARLQTTLMVCVYVALQWPSANYYLPVTRAIRPISLPLLRSHH